MRFVESNRHGIIGKTVLLHTATAHREPDVASIPLRKIVRALCNHSATLSMWETKDRLKLTQFVVTLLTIECGSKTAPNQLPRVVRVDGRR